MGIIKERLAYFNGNFLPESQVNISIQDRGFLYGDAVYDTARTFNGKIFKLREHIERLYCSLKSINIEISITPKEMIRITEELVGYNKELLCKNEDYWVSQHISRGINIIGDEISHNQNPTTLIECRPLPLAKRANLFNEGVDIIIPVTRRTPPECLDPNIKSHNYLNLVMAKLETSNLGPNAWPILLDTRGFLSEGMGSNIFCVSNNVLRTPNSKNVLPGITRQTIMELASKLGISVVEEDLSLNDVSNVDEAFITSTSFCICHARSFNGKVLDNGSVGPITLTLINEFIKLLDFDFREQYLNNLITPSSLV